ncbi:MAG: hypothetical protein HKP37_13205, partial [Boseongicola sp.]|nr:hypothetical protein [Boseongicola sp.]
MNEAEHNAEEDAMLVASLLAIDPDHLGGVWIKARHGARRDWFQALFSAIDLPSVRVTGGTSVQALFGGVDLTESLTHGKLVERKGLLAEPCMIWLNGAERLDRDLIARVVLHTEATSQHMLIVADEGTEDDPLPSEMLRERVAFFLFEDGVSNTPPAPELDAERIVQAKAALAGLELQSSILE